ncbi:TetR/AcrR family transcriptional regulator [Adlercreutzia sp. R25]|uniref:TetR/AcrR family transcriptional regulator n=1 Tax=Adlercreutzia shanghongiae TaxID=3111773 RepID=A0ABU6J1H4_9ACTN|nr:MULTISPECIES: TetR/AcrR family transcriptional regulator [unclassified Adlercreutzia]MEC4273516.1 TetR/AcrR family transcriptional regulator [Adlercreutzia sp. R25]MEC4295953.1 TetR/AcrR family transcriptional regulator [Adlercreutzia sp. R22]
MAKQRDTKETRELIISSAVDLFCEKGYSRTTLEDIVRRVGLTRGAFYWNFKSKKDILDEILKRYEDFYRDIYRDFAHCESAYETLRNLLNSNLMKKNLVNPYASIILYKVESCDEFADITNLQVRMDSESLRAIEEEIRRGQKQGEFRADKKARTLALSVYMSLLGFDAYKTPYETKEDGGFFSKSEIEDFVDLILDSLT